jgi:hypothetical protein
MRKVKAMKETWFVIILRWISIRGSCVSYVITFSGKMIIDSYRLIVIVSVCGGLESVGLFNFSWSVGGISNLCVKPHQ